MKIKRLLASALSLLCAVSLSACSYGATRNSTDVTEKNEKSTVGETTRPDTSALYGYFNPKDKAEIVFRGQRYYNIIATGELIINTPLNGVAYITEDESIEDNIRAKAEGATVYFNDMEEIPEFLIMKTEDYFRGDNYDSSLYCKYTYFCKKEKWSTLGTKLRTQSFENLYMSSFNGGHFFGLTVTVGGHVMIDDDSAAVIKSTVKNAKAETLDYSMLNVGEFSLLLLHRCDKNMLVDPLTDEYLVLRTENGFYVGDSYSEGAYRVSEENQAVLESLFEKYSDTVYVHTESLAKIVIEYEKTGKSLTV